MVRQDVAPLQRGIDRIMYQLTNLVADDDWAELHTYIMQPTFTTPAEKALILDSLEAMDEQLGRIHRVKKSVLAAARQIDASATRGAATVSVLSGEARRPAIG